MTQLNKYLKKFRLDDEVRQWMFDAEQKKKMEELDKRRHDKYIFICNNTRPAKVSDYRDWLEGFIQKGGNATHNYDYDLPNDFVVLTKDAELPTLYGAQSINVIVPEGLTLTLENKTLGHNNIYYIKDYKNVGGWIPVYRNI